MRQHNRMGLIGACALALSGCLHVEHAILYQPGPVYAEEALVQGQQVAVVTSAINAREFRSGPVQFVSQPQEGASE